MQPIATMTTTMVAAEINNSFAYLRFEFVNHLASVRSTSNASVELKTNFSLFLRHEKPKNQRSLCPKWNIGIFQHLRGYCHCHEHDRLSVCGPCRFYCVKIPPQLDCEYTNLIAIYQHSCTLQIRSTYTFDSKQRALHSTNNKNNIKWMCNRFSCVGYE